jgi:HSP20 family protein
MFERTPYETALLGQFRQLEEDLDSLFGSGPSWRGARNIRSFRSGTFPAVNVGTDPESVSVFVFAPGIDPRSLDISIRQNLLTLRGERASTEEREATYYRRERFAGEFQRVISLPEDVDPDRVEARYVDGVVRIVVGRRASAQPRQIEIQ